MTKFEKINDSLALFYKYSKLISKTKLQYKYDMLLVSLAVFTREGGGIIVIYLTLIKFNNINGWNMNELFFLYSHIYLTYGLYIFLFAGLRDFSDLIYEGEFDRYLLRPRGVLYQVMASNIDVFTSIGHGTLGIILFLVSANSVGIRWNAQNIIYYLTVVFGGILIQAAILLLNASLSFWIIKADHIIDSLFWSARRFAGYPISIYPDFIQKILIYVIPVAFINYFPSQYFLRKPDMSAYWNGFMYLTPVIGLFMFVMVYAFWRYSIRKYSSPGN